MSRRRECPRQCRSEGTTEPGRGGLQADLFSEAHFSKQAGWQQSIYKVHYFAKNRIPSPSPSRVSGYMRSSIRSRTIPIEAV